MLAGLLSGVLIVVLLAIGVYLLWYRKMRAEDRVGMAFADHLLLQEQAIAPELELEERLGALECKLAATHDLLYRLTHPVNGGGFSGKDNGDVSGVTFSGVRCPGEGGGGVSGVRCPGNNDAGTGMGATTDPRYTPIYLAYDSGEGLTQIARATGRHKGEIELILNLRKLAN